MLPVALPAVVVVVVVAPGVVDIKGLGLTCFADSFLDHPKESNHL